MNLEKIIPKDGPSIEEVEKYVKKYSNELIVIKCGGSVLLDENLFNQFIENIAVINKLGLSVIDEQHRFGVYQRMAFNYKGFRPSILVMSATPIPRTLTLAAYGDMDESRLIEKPIGRKPIKTTSLTLIKS